VFRPILIVATLTLGLAIGLALATQTFQNSPQQIMLVRNAAVLTAILVAVYSALRNGLPNKRTKDRDPDL
jgi:xanthine/uracil permease